jgi:hypothetical protein
MVMSLKDDVKFVLDSLRSDKDESLSSTPDEVIDHGAHLQGFIVGAGITLAFGVVMRKPLNLFSVCGSLLCIVAPSLLFEAPRQPPVIDENPDVVYDISFL